MIENPLRRAWAEQRATLGLWSALDGSLAPELLAAAGADYVCLDLQHGGADLATAIAPLQAITAGGSVPVVRVAVNDARDIGKALDLGALAVIVPMVADADDARRAVAACTFEPHGNRSFGPLRAGRLIGSARPDDLRDGIACLVMVESAAAVDNVDSIAATPGVDGIYVGAWDLAISLGLEPTLPPFGPQHREALQTIRDACDRHGIVAGLHCLRGEDASAAIRDGFRMITVAADFVLLQSGAARELEIARQGTAGGVRVER